MRRHSSYQHLGEGKEAMDTNQKGEILFKNCKKSFLLRVVRHWSRLLKEVLGSL